jgi:hypothetical protein
MKPRIRKINGLWHCAFLIVGRVGFGYTPRLAYEDWKSMVVKYKHAHEVGA